MTIERDMLGHGDDSNPHPALVRLHAGHEGPGVRLRVVHLHRGEVLHAIVATDSPESVHVCHQGHPAAPHVHAADVVPPVRNTSCLVEDLTGIKTYVLVTGSKHSTELRSEEPSYPPQA